MIHPQYWSLYSIYCYIYGRIRKRRKRSLSGEDIIAYSSLPVKGKRVLDLGAYDGDTAELFLKRGALHVYCVEPVKKWADRIYRFGNKVTVFQEKMNERHFLLDFDCAKIDVEGYEALLFEKGWIKYILDKPCVVESYNWYLTEKFQEHGFHIIMTLDPVMGQCLVMKNCSNF